MLRDLGHDFGDPDGVFSYGMDGACTGDFQTRNNIGCTNAVMVLESAEYEDSRHSYCDV